jgi:hypothetical protein
VVEFGRALGGEEDPGVGRGAGCGPARVQAEADGILGGGIG